MARPFRAWRVYRTALRGLKYFQKSVVGVSELRAFWRRWIKMGVGTGTSVRLDPMVVRARGSDWGSSGF